jgi:alpha-galactosidase
MLRDTDFVRDRLTGAAALFIACAAVVLGLSGGNPADGVARAQNTTAKPEAGRLLAATPPMGWNSWDSFGTTVEEKDVRANAKWLADHLKRFGWEYVVVDMEWFVNNPVPEGNSKTFEYTTDGFGRYTPALNRFPSAVNGAGFKPLADYVHSLGLKFGIHILRGIPKQAVEKNLPVAGSSFHAADAAVTSDTCPWNFDNFGVDGVKPAGQAYYDSIAKLYAGWDVDFIKVDCIASRPYKGDEIRMLSTALEKTGRPIVLSLSPGAAPMEKVDEMRKYAQMWRISNDIWDEWHSDLEYPQGLGDQFPRAAEWTHLVEPGHWPDADMLPLGYLGPAPGWGKARPSGLTHDEQRTFLTLWCIYRSPLMMGGNLTQNDEWTTGLLTNPEVIAVDQKSRDSRPVIAEKSKTVWVSQSSAGAEHYLAAFNLGSANEDVSYDWTALGLASGKYQVRDLWERKDLGSMDSLKVILPSHGSVLYKLTPAR